MPTHKLGGYYLVTSHRLTHPAIFFDQQDFKVFEHYLCVYMAPLRSVLDRYPFLPPRLQQRNLHHDLDLLAYHLSNNQIRLLVHLHWITGINQLIQHLNHSYQHYLKLKYPNLDHRLTALNFQITEVTDTPLIPQIIDSIHLHASSPTPRPWSSAADYHRNRFRPFITKYHSMPLHPIPRHNNQPNKGPHAHSKTISLQSSEA